VRNLQGEGTMRKIEKFAEEIKELVKINWGYISVSNFNKEIDQILTKYVNQQEREQ